MLVRLKSSPPGLNEGHLAALTGDRIMCADFQYPKLKEIFGEGEPAKYVYQTTSGAVRTYKLLADGRRQINAFHLPGDIFGLENGEFYRFTADAIMDTTVSCASRYSLLTGFEHREPGLPSNLLGLVTRNLQHAEDHMLLLGRKTSVEKVAAFLEDYAPFGQPVAASSLVCFPLLRVSLIGICGAGLGGLSLGAWLRSVSSTKKNFSASMTTSSLRLGSPQIQSLAPNDNNQMCCRFL